MSTVDQFDGLTCWTCRTPPGARLGTWRGLQFSSMTAAEKKFATQSQLSELKDDVRSQDARIERLAIRVEVISHDTTRILREVADLREEVNERFEGVEERFVGVDQQFDAVNQRFDKLEKQIADGNAALLSAILKLAKR